MLRLPQRHFRSSLALLLALALAFTQAVGAWHGLSHAVEQHLGHATAPHDPHDEDLFGHHDDAAKCLSLDALTHLGGTCAPPLLPAALPAATHVAWLAAEAAARHTALFEARGPPAIR